MFSFEVDTLEIVLRELAGVVDTFFLIEADRTHKGVKRGRVEDHYELLSDEEASDLESGETPGEV